MNWLKRIVRSIFTKLLLVIVLTGICINLVVGGFFWLHRSAAGRPLHKNILQYLNYIIDDIGYPPELARARRIADQASLQITYEGPNLSWSTADNASDIARARWRDWGCARAGSRRLVGMENWVMKRSAWAASMSWK